MPDATLSIERIATPSLATLRIRKPNEAMLKALGKEAGVTWPTAPNTVASGKSDVFWLGTSEWLIAGGSMPLHAALSRALGETTHHLADVTGGYSVHRITETGARDFLAQGCSLDLHPRVFAPGRCAQTLLAQIPVLIHQRSDAPEFDVYSDVSFAGYLSAWLRDAAIGFAPVSS